MNVKRSLISRIRGWLPKKSANRKVIQSNRIFNKKILVGLIVTSSVILVVSGFFLVSFIGFLLFPIVPADVRIYHTINENKDLLESINGVLAAGIRDNDTRQIPKQLGDYQVFLVRIDNTHPRDREGFIWCSPDLKVWPLETPEAT
jgi:hypothetical protein